MRLFGSGVSPLEGLDIEFAHLQHGLHRAIGFTFVRVPEQPAESVGDNLPGHTKPILQPATPGRFAALQESTPVIIDFFLGPAADKKRKSRGKFVVWAAIEQDQFLPI